MLMIVGTRAIEPPIMTLMRELSMITHPFCRHYNTAARSRTRGMEVKTMTMEVKVNPEINAMVQEIEKKIKELNVLLWDIQHNLLIVEKKD
nr:MAG TPA: hypothetical protein [Caudoviricetes sp.]